jgi:hypothetical protein
VSGKRKVKTRKATSDEEIAFLVFGKIQSLIDEALKHPAILYPPSP